MGTSFQHSHQGVKTKKQAPGNGFSVLRVSFVPNSVSAIKNVEGMGRPLTATHVLDWAPCAHLVGPSSW